MYLFLFFMSKLYYLGIKILVMIGAKRKMECFIEMENKLIKQSFSTDNLCSCIYIADVIYQKLEGDFTYGF